MNELFAEILKNTPADVARLVDRSMDIAYTILEILRRKSMTQKDLAEKLGKSESEISKWLSGTHNFTLKSIAKIEAVLEEDIIVPALFLKEYRGIFAEHQKEEQLVEKEQEMDKLSIPYIDLSEVMYAEQVNEDATD